MDPLCPCHIHAWYEYKICFCCVGGAHRITMSQTKTTRTCYCRTNKWRRCVREIISRPPHAQSLLLRSFVYTTGTKSTGVLCRVWDCIVVLGSFFCVARRAEVHTSGVCSRVFFAVVVKKWHAPLPSPQEWGFTKSYTHMYAYVVQMYNKWNKDLTGEKKAKIIFFWWWWTKTHTIRAFIIKKETGKKREFRFFLSCVSSFSLSFPAYFLHKLLCKPF